MRRYGLLFVLFVFSLFCLYNDAAHAGALQKTQRGAKIDSTGATRIVVKAVAGRVNITGKAGITEVRAFGTAYAPSDDALEKIVLTSSRDANVITVSVEAPAFSPPQKVRVEDDDEVKSAGVAPTPGSPREGRPGQEPERTDAEEAGSYLDLDIEVPEDLPVEVAVTWGEIYITNIKGLNIEAVRSDIEVEEVRGDLSVSCGEGEIKVKDVKGDADLSNENGEITVRHVDGNVKIGRNPFGELFVSDVGGSVQIGKHGRGDITVQKVAGDLVVGEDEGGSIIHNGIGGQVIVPGTDRTKK